MNDWKKDLKTLAAQLRATQKNKKKPRSKFEDQENFRGRKGFNDTGIAITERTIKQQRKNKLNYNKTRYEGSRLQLINDARAAAAQQRRLDNPQLKKRVDALNEMADVHIAEKEKAADYRVKLDRIRSRNIDTSFHLGGKPYYQTDNIWNRSNDDGSVEFSEYDLASAGKSVINEDPVFKNKIEEEIYRLKYKK